MRPSSRLARSTTAPRRSPAHRSWPAAAVARPGKSIAAMQQPDGAIGWRDGHVDAWNHVECAMALTACGLRGPARQGYEWLRATQLGDGSWAKRAADGAVADAAAEGNRR